MNSKPRVKCLYKVLVLCLMLGALVALPTPQQAQSGSSDPTQWCTTQYHNCMDACGGDWYCQANCDDNYAACINDADTESPEKYPVIDRSRSACLEGCKQGADSIEDPNESMSYYMACWNYCNETYPKY